MATTLLEDRFNWLVEFICKKYDLERDILLSRRKKRKLVENRQIIMKILYDCKKNCNVSFADIGRLFINNLNKTGFDHATVLHARKTIDNLIETDREYANKFNYIYSKFLSFHYNPVIYEIFEDGSKIDNKSLIYALTGVCYDI